MSLTSFIKDKDINKMFKDEFKKPRLTEQRDLLSPPITKHYSLIGTAFDYLLRFYIDKLNPNSISRGWVSDTSLTLLDIAKNIDSSESLCDKLYDASVIEKAKNIIIKNPQISIPDVYNQVSEIQQNAEKKYNNFINNGIVDDELLKTVISLAKVDVIYRAHIIDENLGIAEEKDIEDLRNLISTVPEDVFNAKEVCILNPTFNEASRMVGGADADIIIDDILIDIKTVKDMKLSRSDFNQLIGYYILYKIGKVDGLSPQNEITKIAIYFSRYGYLHIIDLVDVINYNTFPEFIERFKEEAMKKYGTEI